MKVRAAVVQAAPVAFDRARTLDKLERLAAEAARQGAELAVFPEAFVSAYPKGMDFGAVVGRRTSEGRDHFRRYFESAVLVPGPDVDRMASVARERRLHLVVGVIERGGGTLYCTALFFGEDGAFLGKHRKLMPTAAERLVWGFGDGSTLGVFDTRVGRIGAVICWENYMPMLRMAMYAKGVQLYCAPTADDRETWLPTMRHVALEGRCFVLSACQVLGVASSIRPGRSSPVLPSTRRRSSPPSWTSTRSRAGSTTSTWRGTMRDRTCSSFPSTRGRRSRSYDT